MTSAARLLVHPATCLLVGVVALAAPAAAVPDESAIAARYRQVLEAVGAGDQEQALVDLEALELATLGERPSPGAVEWFWRLKLGVVRDVLHDSPADVLVPVILLHHDVYLRHRAEHRWLLGNHARTMATELTEFYLKRSQSGAEATAIASSVLTSFAGYLQEGYSLGLAAGYFRRALELDLRNEAAIVGLAATFEKRGQYDKALEYLERAAVLVPDNAQTRLRLALCLKRTGEVGRAAAELRALVAAEQQPWVLALAYQELVDLGLFTGDLAAAERLLSEGLERLPGEPHLSVQKALLLDRDRRRTEATRLVEELDPDRWQGESARYRYTRWPAELLAETRSRLREVLAATRPQLQASLQRPPPPPAEEVAGG